MTAKIIDETGNIYGRWTVIKRAPNLSRNRTAWLCRCECGTVRSVWATSLRNGTSISCGCYRRDMVKEKGYPSRRIDEIGNIYGRLKVVEFAGKDKRGQILWRCKCVCGNETIVPGIKLRSGWTKSCGCFQKDHASLPMGEAAFNKLYGRYKRSARKRNFNWNLDKNQFRYIVEKPCHYCGIEPSLKEGIDRCNGIFVYNGIDRKDNNQGYNFDNVVPCCEDCNRAKLQRSVDEFLEWIKRIYHHNFT